MDETPHQIEAHIDRTRERLGSNFRELESKVDAATDWRVQFRARPQLFLGAAVVGGLVLGAALSPRSSRRDLSEAVIRRADSGSSALAHGQELWHNVKAALVGLASARLKEYISEVVPGFEEHYQRAEQKAQAFEPARRLSHE